MAVELTDIQSLEDLVRDPCFDLLAISDRVADNNALINGCLKEISRSWIRCCYANNIPNEITEDCVSANGPTNSFSQALEVPFDIINPTEPENAVVIDSVEYFLSNLDVSFCFLDIDFTFLTGIYHNTAGQVDFTREVQVTCGLYNTSNIIYSEIIPATLTGTAGQTSIIQMETSLPVPLDVSECRNEPISVQVRPINFSPSSDATYISTEITSVCMSGGCN